jgi:hypothetical protein
MEWCRFTINAQELGLLPLYYADRRSGGRAFGSGHTVEQVHGPASICDGRLVVER